MSGPATNTHEARIEQAIARGRSVEWMAKHLGATLQDIRDAQERLDDAVADDPWFQRQQAGIQ